MTAWIMVTISSSCPGITKKDRPLTAQHFAEFADCYGKDPNGLSKRKDLGETGRFRKFHISEIKERGYKLDVTWLKDDSLEDTWIFLLLGTGYCPHTLLTSLQVARVDGHDIMLKRGRFSFVSEILTMILLS